MSTEFEEIKEAVWQEKKKGISAVWIVPMVALVIGVWLVAKAYMEKGPQIEIYFKSASGIVAGKTPIKYKDVEVGKVTDVTFDASLKRVKVAAELSPIMRPFLSENTRFWVMHAKLGVGEVQGLETLLSGVYIVIDPQEGERKVRSFEGLDHIPVITSREKGTTYIVKTEDIGSLTIGSPVYYRHIEVGRVSSFRYDIDENMVVMEIFVQKPYDRLIRSKTRFFNVSGVYASLSADGIEIQTESLVSVMMGGMAFDNFPQHGRGRPVKEKHTFYLYADKKAAEKIEYNHELYFWTYFDESVRGLSEGAPVEYRGVKIGEVVTVTLIGDPQTAEFKIPILIKIEPQRFLMDTRGKYGNDVNATVFERLLKKGLRAQLKTGNLLTGELYIDLDFYKDVPPVTPYKENSLYVIPAVPTTIASLKSNLQTLLQRIAAIPYEKIGKEMHELIVQLRTQTVPKVDGSVESVEKLMRDTDKLMNAARKNYFDTNAELNRKLLRLLDEMMRTTKSIKHLTDYLERHPESLIKGK